MRLEWDGPTSLFDVIPGIWGTRFVPSFHIKEFTVVILEWILMEPKDESMIYKTRTSLRRERGDSPRIGVFSPFRTLHRILGGPDSSGIWYLARCVARARLLLLQ